MTRPIIASLTLALLAVLTPAAGAQVTCSDIEFADEIRDRYPLVEEACLGILDQDGERFAKLQARVHERRPNSIVIQYMHTDGVWGPYVEVTPSEDFHALVDGEASHWRELAVRQEVNIYIPEGRWAMAMSDVDEPEILPAYVMPVPHVVSAEPVEAVAAPEAAAPLAAEPAEEELEMAPAEEEELEQGAFVEPSSGPPMWLLLLGAAVLALAAFLMIRSRRA
jgi:hypothetical protein